MWDMYKHVLGMPDCENSLNPKFRWQESDPRQGLDIHVWKQYIEDVSGESSCRSPGVFHSSNKNDGTGKCYTYDVLKHICMTIAYVEHPETASYTWEYTGGCYHGNEAAYYEKGDEEADCEHRWVLSQLGTFV